MGLTVLSEDQIKHFERHRVAELIEENADTLINYASDKRNLLELIVFMVKFPALIPPPSPVAASSPVCGN